VVNKTQEGKIGKRKRYTTDEKVKILREMLEDRK